MKNFKPKIGDKVFVVDYMGIGGMCEIISRPTTEIYKLKDSNGEKTLIRHISKLKLTAPIIFHYCPWL